jgi:tetratricopeptide (TPR) repeat protein
MLGDKSLEGGRRSCSRLAQRTSRRGCACAVLALAFCVTHANAQSGSNAAGPKLTRDESAPAAPQKSDRISILRAQINEATDKQERARLQRTLVDYLIALNRKSEAVTELRAMAQDDALDAVGSYNIGNALARLGDTDGAIDAYRKAISLRRGNYARALNNLGVVLIRRQRWDEAVEALSAALKQENSRYAEASYNLGRVYGARGQLRPAIKEWTRVLEEQPDHLDAALALARAYAADGSHDRGIGVIDRFVERQGPNKALIETRNEILRSKAGTGQRSP